MAQDAKDFAKIISDQKRKTAQLTKKQLSLHKKYKQDDKTKKKNDESAIKKINEATLLGIK